VSLFSKIFQQTSWQVLGKIITSLSTFIILGLVARNYGKEGTGIFTLALTYLSMFYILADFGFNAHVLRRVESLESRVKGEWNKLLGTRILWSVLLVVLAVGMLPFWPFSTELFTKAVLFGGLTIIASSVFTTANLIFQSKLRYDLSVLSSGFGTLVGLAVFVLLSVSESPIPFLVLAHFISWIFIALAAVFLIRKLILNVIPIFDMRYTLNLFKDSWPIAATLALNVIYFRADAFMIAYFKSMADAGVYNVAYSVFQSALVLPTFIMNSYYPMMLKTFKGVKFVVTGLLVLSFFGPLATIFLAPGIIQILTGGNFGGSVTSLQILSLGFPAFFVSSLLMWILVATGRYKSMFLIYTSGLILNLILNFVYIPKYSYIGASWTTVISEYFILGMQVVVLLFVKVNRR